MYSTRRNAKTIGSKCPVNTLTSHTKIQRRALEDIVYLQENGVPFQHVRHNENCHRVCATPIQFLGAELSSEATKETEGIV